MSMHEPPPDWEKNGQPPPGIEFEFNVSSCEVGLLTAPPGVPRPARHTIHGTPLLSDTSQGQHLASSNALERAESLRRQSKERGREPAISATPQCSAPRPPLVAVRTIPRLPTAEDAPLPRKVRCCGCVDDSDA